MTPEQSAAIARIKPIAVEFFRWWWNTVGSNTEQGFDTWAAGPGATLLSALEEAQAVRATEPDYLYDPDDWEWTFDWNGRAEATDELRIGEWKQLSTLYRGPDRWVAHVAVTRDDAGDPDETAIRWFNSEAEAKAALTRGDKP